MLTELIIALENEEIKFQTIVILTSFTGMRRGEVLGLEWSDIDFKESFVNILRQVNTLLKRAFS